MVRGRWGSTVVVNWQGSKYRTSRTQSGYKQSHKQFVSIYMAIQTETYPAIGEHTSERLKPRDEKEEEEKRILQQPRRILQLNETQPPQKSYMRRSTREAEEVKGGISGNVVACIQVRKRSGVRKPSKVSSQDISTNVCSLSYVIHPPQTNDVEEEMQRLRS